MSVIMKAKLKVNSIVQHSEESQTITFGAVSKSGGYNIRGEDENNTFARFTPSADLNMLINNPKLIGVLKEGDEVYLDFIKA